MTNKERVISLLGFSPGNTNAVDGALIDFGVNGADTYALANTVVIKKCALQVLELLLSTANVSTSTSGATTSSTTYDRNAVLRRIADLREELGIVIGKPTIKGIHQW